MRKSIISILILLSVLTFSYAQQWQEIRSRHFFLYHNDGDPGFLRETIYYAEKYYNQITDNLGFRRSGYWLWDDRAKIYIYDDQASYVKITGMPEWSGGRARYNEKIIETFPWARGFFTQLLPHELGHIIFREFIGANTRVPLWFEEGVALNQEGENFSNTRKQVIKKALDEDKLFKFDKISSIVLSDLDMDSAPLFYAQSESMVGFLLKRYGRQDFVRLCRSVRDLGDFHTAFGKNYPRYKNLEDFQADWLKYIKANR